VREDIPTAARSALRLSGHDRLFLLGHSMGGLLSYAAGASLLRDVVRGIVTIGSPYEFGAGTPLRKLGAGVLQLLRATGAFDSNPGVPLVWVGDYLRSQRRLWDSRFFPTPIRPWRPGSIEDDVLADYLSHSFDWTSVQVLFDLFAGGSRTSLHSADGRIDYGAAFEALDRPLLVIAGTEDDLAPPRSVRAAFDRSRSRDKTYREFPLGHVDIVIGREAPSTVWLAVSDWLRRR
jgi:pimeloyl-ACP methyl ester carboxylesterase